MIDLTTCVKGQKLRLRNGKVATYVNSGWIGHIHYPHEIKAGYGNLLYYANSGKYDLADHTDGSWDVVEILSLETTEPASHPSVAWWESCPWITDRRPTKEDGDKFDRVFVKTIQSKVVTTLFSDVNHNEAWIHHHDWQPPILSSKEQAIELINNHSPRRERDC
jgi:hypothetical protein